MSEPDLTVLSPEQRQLYHRLMLPIDHFGTRGKAAAELLRLATAERARDEADARALAGAPEVVRELIGCMQIALDHNIPGNICRERIGALLALLRSHEQYKNLSRDKHDWLDKVAAALDFNGSLQGLLDHALQLKQQHEAEKRALAEAVDQIQRGCPVSIGSIHSHYSVQIRVETVERWRDLLAAEPPK